MGFRYVFQEFYLSRRIESKWEERAHLDIRDVRKLRLSEGNINAALRFSQ